MSDAGRGLISWQKLRFYNDVHFWRCTHDCKRFLNFFLDNYSNVTFRCINLRPILLSLLFSDFCIFRKSFVPWSSFYNNVSLRVVASKSIHSDEFLWYSEFFGAIFTMGIARFFRYTWQYNMGRSNGHGCWAHLLFPRGCLSKTAWRFSHFENSTIFVSVKFSFV